MTTTLDATLKARILAAVDANFDKQITDTAALVSVPSTRGAESPAQDLMADLMRRRGYVMDDWTIDMNDLKDLPDCGVIQHDFSRAHTVVGTYRPEAETGRSLILQGHCDVVPAGPLSMWETGPFTPVVKDGWMYGRGAADMKSGTIGALYALDAIRDAGLAPQGRIHLQSVIEEESTGVGALSTLQRGYRADCALLPEPTDQQFNGICVGVIWFRLKVSGEPTHVAVAGEGSNAIRAAYNVILALEGLEREWNERAKADPHYGAMEHPINFNPGIIKGGDWASSVPAWCDIDCRIAVLPGWNVDDCRREIEACVAAAAKTHSFLANNPPRVEWSGYLSHGYVLAPQPEIEGLMRSAHEETTAQPFAHRSSTALNDARFYTLYYGIPAFCYGPHGEKIHGFNERVSLQSLRETTKAMALFIAGWCGVAPIAQG